MKTFALITLVTLFFMPLQAQNEKFKSAMMAQLEKSKTVQTTGDMQVLVNTFARIAEAEKEEWTAWYYAAFYNLVINFQDQDLTRREKFIALSQQQIESGLKAKPDETELLVLKVMSYYGEMSIDPMKAMTLLGEANALLGQAKLLNPDNPRIYLEEAEAVYNMPVEFGGGKEKALPLLLLAKEKFDKFVPADPLSPDWGKDRCVMLLEAIEKQP